LYLKYQRAIWRANALYNKSLNGKLSIYESINSIASYTSILLDQNMRRVSSAYDVVLQVECNQSIANDGPDKSHYKSSRSLRLGDLSYS
jgi:hypothetical protein